MKYLRYLITILMLFGGIQSLVFSQEFDYEKSEAISSIQAMIVTEDFIDAYHIPEADGFTHLEVMPFVGFAICFDLPMRWITEDTKLLFGGGAYWPLILRDLADDPEYNYVFFNAPLALGLKTKINNRPLSVAGGSTFFGIPDYDEVTDTRKTKQGEIPFFSIKYDGNVIFQKLYLNTKIGNSLSLSNDLVFKIDEYNNFNFQSSYLYGYQYFPSSLFLRFDWNKPLYFDRKRKYPDFLVPSVLYKSYGIPAIRKIFPDFSYEAFGFGLQYHKQITQYPVYLFAETYYHLSLLYGCSLGFTLKPFDDETKEGFFIGSLHYNQFWNKAYPEEKVSLWPYLSFTFNFILPTDTFNDSYGGDW